LKKLNGTRAEPSVIYFLTLQITIKISFFVVKVYSPYIRRKLTGCLVFIGKVQKKQPAVLEKVGNPTYKGRQPAAQPPPSRKS